MHPAFLDNLSWEMAEVYGAITDQIMINLSRHFPYFQTGEPVPTSAFAYQAQMLAQMGQVNAETMRIIRNGLEDADLALQGALEQAIIDAVRTTEPELLDAVKQGILRPAGMPTVSPNQYRAFNLYYTQSADKLNLVNTVMLESTNSAYQQTITDVVSEIELAERINATYTALDVASGEVVTGVSSWNQALRHATDRMKNRGITGFIDHAGRHWSAEAYAAMDIRTTMFNTGRAAVWETNQNFGNDLYSVSYHNGARPLCYPYQNKVISATDNARTVVDLDGNEIEVLAQSATSYGQPAGLFGINCKHYPTPFIPGVSVIEGQPQDKEANDKTYAESQEQRRLERNVRERKRDVLMAKAQGAPPEEIKELEAKAKASSEKVDEFCKSTGRARHRDREAVYTKREFPGDGRYNVAEFKDTQQQIINNWYQQGGAQQNFTFGEMTPNEPIVPKQKTFTTVEDYDKEIQRLRDKRFELINQDNYDRNETNRLLDEIFDVQDRRSAFIASQRPSNEPEILKQFKRYDVDSKTAAEKLAQVNPNYRQEGQGKKWTHNCQRTVVAQEMIYRGYDVTAMPYNPKDGIASSGIAAWDTPKLFWKDPDVRVVELRSQFMDTITSAFDEWGDGSRGIVRVQWQKQFGGNGHFIFARRVGGKTIFEDPQSGVVLDISDTLKHTTTGRNQMWVMRVDNRAVSDKIALAIKNVGE